MSSPVKRERSRYSWKIIYRGGMNVLSATLLLAGALAWGTVFPTVGHADQTIPDFADAFKKVTMQADNFYGDPTSTGANPVDYTDHAPIPPSLLLLGSGLFGLALLRRRKSSQR